MEKQLKCVCPICGQWKDRRELCDCWRIEECEVVAIEERAEIMEALCEAWS